MIDINLLRENPDVFRASQRARGKDETHVDRILEADTARRALIGEYETLRAEQNAFGKTVAKAPRKKSPPSSHRRRNWPPASTKQRQPPKRKPPNTRN